MSLVRQGSLTATALALHSPGGPRRGTVREVQLKFEELAVGQGQRGGCPKALQQVLGHTAGIIKFCGNGGAH